MRSGRWPGITLLAWAAAGTVSCSAGTGAAPPPTASPAAGSTAAPPSVSSSTAAPSTASSPTPSATSSVTVPGLDHVDGTDPTAVSRAALTAMWTVDATSDTSQADAYRRASPYLTTSYYADLTAQPVTTPIPQQWRDHRAYTRVELTADRPEGDLPTSGPYSTYRAWKLTVRPIGRDGWRGAALRLSAFVRLERPAKPFPWRVVHVGVS
ncbi:hypothetical protein ACSNOI_39275 [Actinomadura kijaniata]|uniref:hypothetical protein n=1 Tax=Actinomadura kijaniata TaxID=46161 RepID=UPI003F1AEFCF